MERISPPITSAANLKKYHDESLTLGDYYIGDECIGLWGGEAADRLGLEGTVSREAFHQLCDNINPATGKQLTARKVDNRRIANDISFSSPKTVSVMYELTGDERILRAFNHASRSTMRDQECDAECRVRDNGQNSSRTTGNLVWGEFVHFTSRPVDGVPDPQLHAHFVTFNATWDAEYQNKDGSFGMWKAADIGTIKRDARYFEATFHARFAAELASIGYPIKRDGKGFWEIAGIPTSVKDKFSRRTAEIDALAEELGITDPDQKAKLGATSRSAKTQEHSREDLRKIWDSWLTDEEREAIALVSESADGTPRTPTLDAADTVSHAIEHSYERKSAVSDRQLAEQALRHGVGAVGVRETWKRIEGLQDTGTIIAGNIDDRTMVTTRAVLAEERQMLEFARDGIGACAPLGSPNYAFQDELFANPDADTEEQEKAIRGVLGSHDRVVMVRGAAGAGKTTLMREVASGIIESGHQIYAFAPTAAASRGVLRDEGFRHANTVEQLLRNKEGQKIRGQVLWIDEAGLLGAQTLNRVFKVAKAQGCRVILTGDTRQHTPVERGDAMRVLEVHGGIKPIKITKIQRQRVHKGPEPEQITQYRKAVEALSEADPTKGFAQLEAMGAVVDFEIEDGLDVRCKRIADDYVEALGGRNLKGRGNSVLAVSPTHAEGDAVTKYIREALKQAGKIAKTEHAVTRLVNLHWTKAERKDASKYQAGQIIQLHQNVPGGFTRGHRYTVVGANGEGIRVKDEAGKANTLPLSAASRFSVYAERELAVAKGDRIRITQNGFTADKKHRLNNGALYSVKSVSSSGKITLNNGWVVDSSYGHLSHGYVTTSHASQGKTVDVVLIAQGSQSLSASSMEQVYVSVSRGREQVKIYTDDREGLRAAIQRSGQRVSATEVAKHQDHGANAARDRRLMRRRFDQVRSRSQRPVNRQRRTHEHTHHT